MHELSIAQEIIGIVDQYVAEDKSSVTKIRLKIGKLSNVVVDSLIFCFDAIKSDSNLQNAELVVDEVPIAIKCNTCNSIEEVSNFAAYCPNCNGTDTVMISGSELNVTEIEID
ncbi:MAG: hydrogenase maturation nickel metallochaperone HypA [Bacteroidetes bacterium]|nr:hydrogenase maturation nickel metallochaperone HypA [Bacteroidota bacterium]MBU1680479.1 hydrogenase maturation nickel metallochaperone HypA [Bacteroidota bacterium]MBU2507963.1 hydrogenase maturation nickel metallochaperone HypA [Bacteroidota bacterium]